MANSTFATAHSLRLLLTALFLLVPPRLLAQEGVDNAIRLSRQGLIFNARALGMGNAYSTIGDDFTALRMNPATLGFSKGATYTMSVNTSAFVYSSDFYGSTSDFTTTNTTLSQAGLTFPIRLDSTRYMHIGLGYTMDKDFNAGAKYAGYNEGNTSYIQRLAGSPSTAARSLGLIYPVYDEAGRYVEDRTILTGDFEETGYILDAGNLVHLQAGISLQAAAGVHFGVSGSYNTGVYKSDRDFSAVDTRNVYADTVRTNPADPRTAGFQSGQYRDIRNTTYKGWDVRFGLVYRLENFIGVSVAFKAPLPHTVFETRYQSGSTLFSAGNAIGVDPVPATSEYQLLPPYEATVGASINLWFLTGTAEATYVDYSAMLVTGGMDIPEQSDINKRIKDEMTRVVNLNAGAEFRLPFTGLIARAGAMYRPSPYKADPSRYDQKFVTLGFGINSSDRLYFDIGYLYRWNDAKKDETQSSPDPSIEQTVKYHDLLISAKFEF